MKITIYELLGLIKDGKAPKKIKVDSYILDLVENETNWRLSYIDGYDDYLFRDYHLRLDDEILVLEEVEDKEYKDIEVYDYTDNHEVMYPNTIANNFVHLNEDLKTITGAIKYILERLDNDK